MSYNAYQKAQQRTETPAEVEYRLFSQVTRSLVAVEDAKATDQALINALDWNRRMWSTLSADCSVKGNGLPNELRASIISLSMWVSKHSSAISRGEETVSDLIQVNKTIMEGLSLQIQNSRKAPVAESPTSQSTNTMEQSTAAHSPTVSESTNATLIGQNFKPTNI